jgi:hypothetical protein
MNEMNWKTVSAGILALATLGCAAPQDNQGPAAAGVTCTQEVPTGSNMPRRVCSTPKSDADRDADAREMSRRAAQAPSFPR